jgi:hypothetical protein
MPVDPALGASPGNKFFKLWCGAASLKIKKIKGRRLTPR